MSWPYFKMPRGTLESWVQALTPNYLPHWLSLVDSLLGEDARIDGCSRETVERRAHCRDAAHCGRFIEALTKAGLAIVSEREIRFPFLDDAWDYREATSARNRRNGKGGGSSRQAPELAATGSRAARGPLATGSGGEFLKENHNYVRAVAKRSLVYKDEDKEKEKESPPLSPSPRRADVARIVEQATTAIASDRRSKWLGNEVDGAGSSEEAEAVAPPPPVAPSEALRASNLAKLAHPWGGARSRR